jgi:uncharacterized repeat protein (TIGR01451 family)
MMKNAKRGHTAVRLDRPALVFVVTAILTATILGAPAVEASKYCHAQLRGSHGVYNKPAFVCETPDPTPTPTPTPTPALTPSPTPTPTPESSPEPEDGDEGSEPTYGLAIQKTDHRDVTRPGHSLTYEIIIENTGNETIGDVEVTDIAPRAVTVTAVTNDGRLEGQKISWPSFALGASEKISLFVTVTVSPGTSAGYSLVNVVKVKSENEGLSATDTDTTIVETIGQVKATMAEKPQPVPVTARTGTGSLGALATLFGGTGLAAAIRHRRR